MKTYRTTINRKRSKALRKENQSTQKKYNVHKEIEEDLHKWTTRLPKQL